MLAAQGAGVVDTDLVAREVVAPGTPGLAAVREAFGSTVLAPDGTLDRGKLRAIVFADAGQRARLERTLHPLIRAATLSRLRALEAPYAVVVVPLLVETDFIELVDRVLVVDCAPEIQIERVMRRDGVTRPEAEAILAAQTDRATRLQAADDVIDNSGDLEHARAQAAALHARYSSLARNCRGGLPRAE